MAERGTRDGVDEAAHVVADQEAVFALMADPRTYGGAADVRRIDTHGAAVFLAEADVYKVKRAVRFPFMDLSTLEKRRSACDNEIAVNRRYAPALYLGIVPIVRRRGRLSLGGEGEPVEWAVHMRRFDETMTLDQVAERGELSDAILARTARIVARSHAEAPVADGVDFARALRGLIEENGTSLVEAGLFEEAEVTALTRLSLAMLEETAPLIRRRAAGGAVRRCHGDLHLRNIALIDGEPTLFDAIEFDEALATIDVLYDLAFLVMDLWHRGLERQANLMVNRYVVETGGDAVIAGLAALPLFVSLRAAIRAKVEAANLGHVRQGERRAAEDSARAYLDLARAALRPSPPLLVGIGGLSGTGKTTLAAALAPFVGRLPGALHLRSDVERKRRAGVEETERLPAQSYSRDAAAAIYDALCHKARLGLEAGQAVIVDAVQARPEERSALADVAAESGVAFVGLWLDAPAPVLARRVEARRGDASDADAAVVALQLGYDLGKVSWHRLDAGGDRGRLLDAARRLLT